MASIAQIYEWFMTGKKPTQAQFWTSWGSFWNKEESIPQSAIQNLSTVLNAKTENSQFNGHLTDANAHTSEFESKEDKNKKGTANGYAPLNEFVKLAIDYLDVVNDLVTGGEASLLTAEQGKLLQTQINNINILLASDNVNLDSVQELVDAIETIQMSLDTVLVNDLTTGGTTKALTAEMGKTLKGLIDVINKAVNYKTPQQYGAIGDGITDDTVAVQNAVNSGYPVSLGGKNISYLITSSITIPDNGSIFGRGAVLKTTLDISILILGKNSNVDCIVFTGDGKGTGKLNQIGVFIDGGAGYSSVSNTNVSNCTFNNMSGSGYLVKRVVGNHEGNMLSNSKFVGCRIGVNIEERAEYTIVNSCSVYLCDTGISIRGGNSLISSCVVSDNVVFGIIVLNGENDAHGTVTDTFIKHNSNYALKIESTSVKDFTFNNCQITFGKVWLYKCEGVVFNGCTFSAIDGIYEEGAKNCYVRNYTFIGDIITYPNYNTDPSQVFYIDGILDQLFNATSIRRLQSPYSHMRLTNLSHLIVPNGNDYIFNWDEVYTNSISRNLNYTLHNLWDSVNKYWDFQILKTSNGNHFAYIDVQLSVGRTTGAAPNAIDTVDIYLYDVELGRRVGNFSVSPSLLGIYRIHSFNGTVPKGQIQIRINNNTGDDIKIYRDQGGMIPGYGIATGW